VAPELLCWALLPRVSPGSCPGSFRKMKLLLTIVAVGAFSKQADATSLRRQKDAPAADGPVLTVIEGPAAPAAAPGPKGVGNLQDFAHLLPFHPRGQQELLMKTRCVNFLNHVLEKSAYSPDAVGALMPKCKWTPPECAALKDDLMKRLVKGGAPAPAPAPASALLQKQPWPERGAPKDNAVTWINGPRGPQPNFVTQGGMDESIYGWCDTMYDMMRTKAIDELAEEQRKAAEKKREAAMPKAAQDDDDGDADDDDKDN